MDFLKINLVLVMLLAHYFMHGQQQQSGIEKSVEDVGYLVTLRISDSGQWGSYLMKYKNAQDTLVVTNTSYEKQYTFPGAGGGEFISGTQWYACKRDKQMILTNLKVDTVHIYNSVISYSFSEQGRFLALLYGDSSNSSGKVLEVKDLVNGTKFSISQVNEYKFKDNYLSYLTDGSTKKAVLHDLHSKEPILLHSSKVKLKKLTWNKGGTSLAFMEEVQNSSHKEVNHRIYFYNIADVNLKESIFDPYTQPDFPQGNYIADNYASILALSDDGKRVIFDLKPYFNRKEEEGDVQIWYHDDEELYPARGNVSYSRISPKRSVWWPGGNRFLQVGTVDNPVTIFTADQKHALVTNGYKSPSISTFSAPKDYYLVDLELDKRTLMLEDQTDDGTGRYIQISPKGRFVAYYRNKNWWVYDINSGHHLNISKQLPFPVYDEKYDRAGEKPAYDQVYWAKDDSALFLYDKYDIWKISPDGSQAVKMTNGREQQLEFRLQKKVYKESAYNHLYAQYLSDVVDTDLPLVLEVFNPTTKDMGYSICQEEGGIKDITWNSSSMKLAKKARTADVYIFREESYNKAPAVKIISNGGVAKTMVSSKSHLKNHQVSRAELIHYKGVRGEDLQGILYYPYNFKQGEKYPMVTHIYERQSDTFHRYLMPGLLVDLEGINFTNFLKNGYFVLLPDISYKLNEVGASATSCVVAAVTTALKTGNIDANRLGLMGYSFGGYETNLILSQTQIFATAVAGGAPSDAVSNYLGMGWNDRKPEIFRYENGMWRFKGSFYENKEAYLKNSPVHHAEKIKTPLLLYNGEKDGQVDWYQGIEMYLAMRRLKKKCVFLVYPDEDHIFIKESHKQDISKRILDWFDYYLKTDHNAKWITQ